MGEATAGGPAGPAVPPARPRRRPQYSDEAAAHVRELIMSGQVRAGEYLRVERLAGELGISATPVREGLLALRGEGFVQLEPRRGFVVLPLRREDVLDLYLVQAGLAGELAAKAATRVDDAQIAEIERLQRALEDAAAHGDADAIEALNHEFHRAINLAARAPKLSWFLSMATRYAPRRFYPTIRGWQSASVEDHREVIDALRRGHAADARAAMRAHIMHAGDLLATHLDADRRWE
jgi:DNA-binding GntR family transcriptional regulator